MARKLERFPGDEPNQRRYPWNEWTDGGAWEIRQGEDYDVKTENMRVNLHMRADAEGLKVRTRKLRSGDREGLVFQFFEDPVSAEEHASRAVDTENQPGGEAQRLDVDPAIAELYADALDIYERARAEVTISRSDGSLQKYAAVRYKQQIDRAYASNELVPAIARIVRKPTLGFGHLEAAKRPDLMVETLVTDVTKPYHRLFSSRTGEIAQARLKAYWADSAS